VPRPTAFSNNQIGIASALTASFFFSINDMSIKFLSGDYALHEVVLIRSLLGMVVVLAIVVPLEGGLRILKTKRLGIHLFRGVCVVFANMTFFLGLAAMNLADAVAIFFVSPLIITALSVVMLGEKVGPRRWAAVLVGLVGVIVMMRPGTDAFRMAALLPLVAAAAYAMLQIMTRKLGVSEKAATMTFYIQLTFVVVSLCMGLAFGQGTFSGSSDPSLEFLFRAWVAPAVSDYYLLVLIGVGSALGGYFISQAYRLAEAGLAAPFEYIALPLAVIWDFTVFGKTPDLVGWIGILLIMGAGLYAFWRETARAKPVSIDTPTRR